MTEQTVSDESWARAVLGIGPQAGRSDVQRAFRSLSKTRHPDHGGTGEAFDELLTAYELLRSTGVEPVAAWVTGCDDAPSMSRMAWDSRPPPPRRRTFRQLFADALREQRH